LTTPTYPFDGLRSPISGELFFIILQKKIDATVIYLYMLITPLC